MESKCSIGTSQTWTCSQRRLVLHVPGWVCSGDMQHMIVSRGRHAKRCRSNRERLQGTQVESTVATTALPPPPRPPPLLPLPQLPAAARHRGVTVESAASTFSRTLAIFSFSHLLNLSAFFRGCEWAAGSSDWLIAEEYEYQLNRHVCYSCSYSWWRRQINIKSNEYLQPHRPPPLPHPCRKRRTKARCTAPISHVKSVELQ